MFLLLCLKIERLRSCFSAESTAPAVSNHTAYFLFFSFYILNQYQNCIWYNHQNSLQERTAEEQQVLFWCAESGIKKAQSFTSLCAGLKNKLITNTTAVCCNVSSFPPLSARCLLNRFCLKQNSGRTISLCFPSLLSQSTIWRFVTAGLLLCEMVGNIYAAPKMNCS